MLKKALMISVYLFIGWQAKAAVQPTENMTLRGPASEETREVSAEKPTICMMEAHDTKKIKYKSDSYKEAFSKVTSRCFEIRNEAYFAREKVQPDQDRQIQFAESCLNNITCI